MKFVLSAGGTAGHINPAIAVAQELIANGHKVWFAGTPNRLESRLIPQEGFDFVSFNAAGFNRNHPMSIFAAISSIDKSTKSAKRWLEEIQPDAVMGFGCYVSLAICRAAIKLNIPVVIHEQNSVMGLANKYLSKRVQCTCLTYKHADNGKCKKVIITGNPVRSKFYEASREQGREKFNIPQDATLMVCFGGSLGAKHINDVICDLNDRLMNVDNLYVVHITGKDQYEEVSNKLVSCQYLGDRYKIYDYQNHMDLLLAAADFCISRSGASSLAEITALHVPALLVPYPYATENHQYYNAQSLVEAGCCECVLDEDLDKPEFKDKLFEFITNYEKRQKMCECYKLIDSSHAAETICNILEDFSSKTK